MHVGREGREGDGLGAYPGFSRGFFEDALTGGVAARLFLNEPLCSCKLSATTAMIGRPSSGLRTASASAVDIEVCSSVT